MAFRELEEQIRALQKRNGELLTNLNAAVTQIHDLQDQIDDLPTPYTPVLFSAQPANLTATTTFQALNWNNIVVRDPAYTGTSTITISEEGLYQINADAYINSASAIGRMQLEVSGSVVAQDLQQGHSGAGPRLFASVLVYVTSPRTVRVLVNVNTGTAGVVGADSHLSIVKLR